VARVRADYRSLFDNAPEAIVVFDLKDCSILEANKLALEFYGFTRPEFLGSDFSNLQTDRSTFKAHVAELRAKGRAKEFKTSHNKRDGSSSEVSINSIVIDFGERLAVQSHIREVSADRDLDEATPSRRKKLTDSSVRIDNTLVRRLLVVYSGFIIQSAMKELLADQPIECKYLLYPDNYTLENNAVSRADFVIFALSRVSRLEVEDLKAVCRERSDLPVLVVSIETGVDAVIEMIQAGIRGVIIKDKEFSLVPAAVNAIMKGEFWFPRAIMQKFFENYSLSGLSNGRVANRNGLLSEREGEILKLIVKGLKNKEIASKLGISYSTVLTHIYNIYRKLEVNNRAQAISRAHSTSLVKLT
jgi:two-component system response regulator DegU